MLQGTGACVISPHQTRRTGSMSIFLSSDRSRSISSVNAASDAARKACGGQQHHTVGRRSRGGTSGTNPAEQAARLSFLPFLLRSTASWTALPGSPAVLA